MTCQKTIATVFLSAVTCLSSCMDKQEKIISNSSVEYSRIIFDDAIFEMPQSYNPKIINVIAGSKPNIKISDDGLYQIYSTETGLSSFVFYEPQLRNYIAAVGETLFSENIMWIGVVSDKEIKDNDVYQTLDLKASLADFGNCQDYPTKENSLCVVYIKIDQTSLLISVGVKQGVFQLRTLDPEISSADPINQMLQSAIEFITYLRVN